MGRIVSVKHFEIHDGDGIRTTLFLKGCSLRCAWCHNPECLVTNKQLAILQENCTSCGECGKICANHSITERGHLIDKEKCIHCGRCVEACLNGALRLYGKDVSVDEILPELLQDRMFYGDEGGVTISGGEPLMQCEFVQNILARLKENGINTAVDTCGHVPQKAFEAIVPLTDTFLYDIKAIDEDVHIRCTGYSNKQILANLKYLDALGVRIEIRYPYVPGMNDDQIEKIGEFLSNLTSVYQVKVLAYHDFAITKYESLDMAYPAKGVRRPSKEEMDAAVRTLSKYGLKCILDK